MLDQSITSSIVREGHLEHDCLVNSAILSIDALNELLLNAPMIIESEDSLLEAIIGLGPELTNLIPYLHFSSLSVKGNVRLLDAFDCDSLQGRVWTKAIRSMIQVFLECLNSTILWEFSSLFGMFTAKWISLLWRWTRDSFSTDVFHNYCDRHSHALMIVIDTNDNIVGV
jgi:hypothetical protein